MVYIIDFKKNLKDALNDVWPNARQQLYIFHINWNIDLQVKKKWQKPQRDKASDDDSNDISIEGNSENVQKEDNNSLYNLNNAARSRRLFRAIDIPRDIPHTKEGLLDLQKFVIYAYSETNFKTAWVYMLDEFHD